MIFHDCMVIRFQHFTLPLNNRTKPSDSSTPRSMGTPVPWTEGTEGIEGIDLAEVNCIGDLIA